MARTIGWIDSEVKKPEQVKEPVPEVKATEEPVKKTVKKTTKK